MPTALKDLLGGTDKPKEIEISCAQDPIVTIKDLIDEQMDVGECMKLTIIGPTFNARLSIQCEDE